MRGLLTATMLVFSARSLCASTPGDHLVPPYSDRDWGVPGYNSLVEKKLFITPASYGRILVRPSMGSQGEYAFSLYRIGNDSVQITYTKASRNIWSYLSAKRFAVSRSSFPREPWEN